MLQSRVGFFLAVVCLLSACQVPGTAGSKSVTQAATKAQASASPAVLLKPDGASTLLTGTVEIDAHYLLGTGKGRLLGAAGTNVIAAGGGNLLGQAGTNLLGAAGTNLLGAAGTNLIGKRKYDALAVADATTTVGQTLPAAEMEIMVYSLADGQPLTLGKDKDGKAVVSIYTDAAGGYKVYLPNTIAGNNVRVVAKVPDTSDARLDYQLVTTFGEDGSAAINEDTAVASTFLREAFVSRMERLFIESETKGVTGDTAASFLPAGLAAAAAPLLKDLYAAVAEGKVGTLPADKRKLLARKATDVLLGYVDLSTLKLKTGEPTMPTLVKALQEFRQAATAKMAADEHYFDQQDFLTKANAATVAAGGQPYVIKRPADLNDFVLHYILQSPDRTVVNPTLNAVLATLDLPQERTKTANDALESLATNIALTLVSDAKAKAEVVAVIKAGQ